MIERSSGKVLLSQSSTGVTFGAELYPASAAASVSKTSNSLQAELLLQLAGRESMPGGTPFNARVSFSFLKPEILQVSITYKDASPAKSPRNSTIRANTTTASGSSPSGEAWTTVGQTGIFSAWGTNVSSSCQRESALLHDVEPVRHLYRKSGASPPRGCAGRQDDMFTGI